MCDVCGHYILPMPEELVNFFGVQQLPGQQLCCHNKCKQAILDCNGDWQKLPDGPLRKGYEEAAAKLSNDPAHLRAIRKSP